MKNLQKIFSFILTVGLLAQSAAAGAQGLTYPSRKKQQFQADEFFRALSEQAAVRRPEQTAGRILAGLEQAGRVSGCEMASVLNDASYIQTLDADEAADLAYASAFAEAFERNCDKKLLNAVLPRLQGEYDEDAPDFALKSFYAKTAGGLGRNPWLWREVQNWAFKQAEQAAEPLNSARNVWASAVLWDLAQEVYLNDGAFVMDAADRARFEQRLERTIAKFNWMKDFQTDYMLPGVKSGKAWSTTNQAALIALFAQANSFFAYKENMVDPQSPFFMQMLQAAHMMFTTGGFNELGRMAINAADENAQTAGFSDTGEVFYLHTPTPGSDGRGHFALSANGRRHLMLTWLTEALFLSYATRPARESSELMQRFVRSYLKTDEKGRFTSYLFMALVGMREGLSLLDSEFLEGWEREEAQLQAELHSKLKAGYAWRTVCTAVQGACEVAGEWMAVGKLLGWVFKGLGWGGKTLGRGAGAAASKLPAGALARLAVAEVGARNAVRWSRQSIRAALHRCGWKAAAATGAAAAMTSDSRSRSVAR